MANYVYEKWLERYEILSNEIKEELTKYKEVTFQLKKIKGTRKYPEIGDIFEIKATDDIVFQGVVINNHINNICGEDLILVCIFKEGVNATECIKAGIKESDLLIKPDVVGKEYWTRGYFYNIDRYEEKINIEEYCFYSVGKDKFFDEYGKECEIKKIIGIFGVATVWGIGDLIGKELIINGTLSVEDMVSKD